MAECFDDRGNAEFLEGFDFCGDDAEDRPVTVDLFEIIATEAVVIVHFIGEVEIASLLEFCPSLLAANFPEHETHFFRGENFLADRDDLTVPADLRRLSFAEMKIGRSRIDQNLEKLVNVGHVSGIR